jgi:hypothetical protein
MPSFRHQLRAVRVKKRDWLPPWTLREWAPTGEEKDRWIKAADGWYTTSVLTDPTLSDDARQAYVTAKLRDEAMEAGVGPLTWLWIASMVVQLVRLWREWKRDQ